MDLEKHKARDLYECGDFDIIYCATMDMLVHIVTKPLGSTQTSKLRKRLNVVPLPLFKTSDRKPTKP